MQFIYLIIRNGKLLNQLFVDDVVDMFQLDAVHHTYDVGELYFYTEKHIAHDVAKTLDAKVISAHKIGTRVIV